MSRWVSHCFCCIVAALVAFAFSPRGSGMVHEAHLNLERIQINDITRSGDTLVAVGERGSIVKSHDDGQTWNVCHDDKNLPITLTALTPLTDQVLLAVGHDGLILRSHDAGENWTKVMHDNVLGEPLLGVWSGDGRNVFAYGSFGKLFISHDAGLSWTERTPEVLQGEHINGMDGTMDGRLLVVGEMGLALRSVDGGQHWQRLEPFYNGSLFGVIGLPDRHWVAYGMRGHVFVSRDDGDTWEQVVLSHQLPLYGHVRSKDTQQGAATAVIVGTAGAFVRLDARGRLIESGFLPDVGTLTSIAELKNGRLFIAGQFGLMQSEKVLMSAQD